VGRVRRGRVRHHRGARGGRRAALRRGRAREHHQDAAGVPADARRLHGPGPQGDLGRAAAQAHVHLPSDGRPDDVRGLQPRLPQRRLQPDRRGAANIPGVEDLFDKETADTYEAGVKSLFLDRRLSVNASVFLTQAEGSYFFVYDPNTGTQNLGNLDEVDYQGFELEFQAAATDWLDLYARAGYTDSEIKKSSRSPDDVGNQAPLVSEYTINLGAPDLRPAALRRGPDLLHPARLPDHRRHLLVPGQLHRPRPGQPA